MLACKGIAEGVENSNYFLQTSAGSFILTLYEKRVREEDLPFFLALMDHLAARGLTCPQPVHNRNGNALGRLAGRPAVIVTFLNGVSVKRPSARHCRALGSALGAAARGRARLPDEAAERAVDRRAGRALFAAADGQADTVAPGLAERTRRELAHLAGAWPAGLPTGVIHADLFTDNVFFIGDRLSGLIDFYFACTDALAYDLAICLNAWCFEPDGSFNLTKGQAMIAGYEKVRRLEPEEAEALPTLCRGSALRFMLTRLVDWLNVPPGALVKPKDPLEYDRKLAFHRHVRSAAEYGLVR